MIDIKGKTFTQIPSYSSSAVLLSSFSLCIFYGIIFYKVVAKELCYELLN